MAMMCLEEPLCPNSPIFKPCRFLLQAQDYPSSLNSHIDLDQRSTYDTEHSLDRTFEDGNRRNKKSILNFLNNKVRKNAFEKNQLK